MREHPIVVHLIDDATAGGVTRVVDHILTDDGMAKLGTHHAKQIARGVPRWQSFDADVIVSHLSISWRNLPVLLAIRAANPGKKLVHIEHSYTEAFVALNVKKKKRFFNLLKIAYAVFDTIVAVSEGQAAWISRQGLCSDRKLRVIQSCIDLAPFASLAPRSGEKTVFGAIGRLDRQKGFDTLIKAFRRIEDDDAELRIYGAGEEEAALRNLAAGDTRIVFCGFANDPLKAYRDVDVVVMPSRWEAYGLVAIEALTAKRQLITSDVDGLLDHRMHGARTFRLEQVSDLVCCLRSAKKAEETRQPAAALAGLLQTRFVSQWREVLTS